MGRSWRCVGLFIAAIMASLVEGAATCNRTLLELSGCAANVSQTAVSPAPAPFVGGCNMSSIIAEWSAVSAFAQNAMDKFRSRSTGAGPDNCCTGQSAYRDAVVAPCGTDLTSQRTCIYFIPRSARTFLVVDAESLTSTFIPFSWLGDAFGAAAAAPCGGGHTCIYLAPHGGGGGSGGVARLNTTTNTYTVLGKFFTSVHPECTSLPFPLTCGGTELDFNRLGVKNKKNLFLGAVTVPCRGIEGRQCVIMPAFHSPWSVYIDTEVQAIARIFNAGNGYAGGVAAPCGAVGRHCVYMSPGPSTLTNAIGVLDAAAFPPSFKAIGGAQVTSFKLKNNNYARFKGAVFARNALGENVVFMLPHRTFTPGVLRITAATASSLTDTVTIVGRTEMAAAMSDRLDAVQFEGGAMAPCGRAGKVCLFLSPYAAKNVVKIDAQTGETTLIDVIGSSTRDAKFAGAVTLPCGGRSCVYFPVVKKHAGSGTLRVDATSGASSFVGPTNTQWAGESCRYRQGRTSCVESQNYFFGAVVAPCGGGKRCGFMVPHGATSVGRIDDVPCASTLSHLTTLSHCTELDYLCVHSCSACRNLKPLGGFLNITGFRDGGAATSASIVIGANAQLEHVDELRGISGSLPGGLAIVDNAQLRQIDGLGSAHSVGVNELDGSSLHIEHNPKLTSIRGMAGLQGNVPGALIIRDSPALHTLSGIGNVKHWGAVSVSGIGNTNVTCTDRDCLQQLGGGGCPAGFGLNTTAANTSQPCITCVQGRWSSDTGTTPCNACSRGKHGANASIIDQRAYASTTSPEHCLPCLDNEYQDEEGQTQCKLCPRGSFHTQREAQNVSACVFPAGANAACPVGQASSTRDVSSCRNCTAGRFKDDASNKPCKQCACGRFSAAGAVACDSVCVPGTFGNATSGVCDPCLPEHFCVNSQMRPFSEALICIAGEFQAAPPSSAADRVCKKCSVGQFSRGGLSALNCTVCPAGKFQHSVGQPFCETYPQCGPGKYVVNASATTTDVRCKVCEKGHFCSDEKKTRCDFKFDGFHCEEEGLSFPRSCEEGYYCAVSASEAQVNPTGSEGLVVRRACPPGFACTAQSAIPCVNKISNTSTGQCISCPDGTFANTNLNLCTLCPDIQDSSKAQSMKCRDGVMTVSDDFFVVGASASNPRLLGPDTTAIRCREPDVCVQVHNNVNFSVYTRCIGGTRGVLCGACDFGYGLAGSVCVKCKQNNIGVFVVLVSAGCLFIIVVFGSVKSSLKTAALNRKTERGGMTVIKIFVDFFFKTSLLSYYNLDWGGVMQLLLGINAAASSGDVLSFGAVECIGVRLRNRMWMLAAVPLIILCMPLPLWWWAKRRGYIEVLGAPIRNVIRATLLIGWWLMHPMIMAECIKSLFTLKVGDKSYISNDLTIEVGSADATEVRTISWVLLVTFVPGVPLFVFFSMMRRRRLLLTEEGQGGDSAGSQTQQCVSVSFRRSYYYFYGSFRPQYFYWEFVKFTSKTLMVVVASFASVEADPSKPIFTATWVALISFMLEFKYEPYRRKSESTLLKVTDFVMLALLLCAQGLALNTGDPNFRAGVRTVASILLFGVMLLFVRTMFGEMHRNAVRLVKGSWRRKFRNKDGSIRESDASDAFPEFPERDTAQSDLGDRCNPIFLTPSDRHSDAGASSGASPGGGDSPTQGEDEAEATASLPTLTTSVTMLRSASAKARSVERENRVSVPHNSTHAYVHSSQI